MKSVLRFIAFAIILAAAVTALYFWRTTRPVNAPAESATPAASGVRLPLLQEMDREFTTLVGQVLPSVVSINAIPPDAINPRLQLLRRLMGADPSATPLQMGSGVVVSKDGHIVTNYHVIVGAGAVEVTLNDGRVVPAKLLGSDPASDIAILKIEADGLDPIPWGNSDAVLVGQMVFAVGNPLGLQETVTQGIISAKGRRAASEAANEFFQTDAAINRGNSGGPLVDLRGQLIGITNMIPVQAQGIAFAIPANTVRRVFESIRDHGRFIRPWFGALTLSLSPQLVRQLRLSEDTGTLVVVTYQGSPAEKAGLVPGDVIVAMNDKPIIDNIELRNRMAEAKIGDIVTLRVRRGRDLMDVKLQIAPDPES